MMRGKERKDDERCPFYNGSYAVNGIWQTVDGWWQLGLVAHIQTSIWSIFSAWHCSNRSWVRYGPYWVWQTAFQRRRDHLQLWSRIIVTKEDSIYIRPVMVFDLLTTMLVMHVVNSNISSLAVQPSTKINLGPFPLIRRTLLTILWSDGNFAIICVTTRSHGFWFRL